MLHLFYILLSLYNSQSLSSIKKSRQFESLVLSVFKKVKNQNFNNFTALIENKIKMSMLGNSLCTREE